MTAKQKLIAAIFVLFALTCAYLVANSDGASKPSSSPSGIKL
jgi:hypothetical protein